MVLGVLTAYRVAAAIYMPWIDIDLVLGRGSAVNLLSGGALGSSSILALGIVPALIATVVLHLYHGTPPKNKSWSKRWIALGVALVQAGAVVYAWPRLGGTPLTPEYTAATVLTLCAGAMFTLWLAELIDEKGLGNGGCGLCSPE